MDSYQRSMSCQYSACQAPPPFPNKSPTVPNLFIRFQKSSPGETVQCLNRSILIHDTTFEQIRLKKNLEHFYILLSRSKKRKLNIGIFYCLPVLHSDFQLATSDVLFCHKEKTTQGGLDGNKHVCWLLKQKFFFVINKGTVQWIVCIGKCLS